MIWIQEWLLSGLRLSLPLIFAAYGGMLSERCGVANIALEAYLLASSFAAAATMALSHSFVLGISAGVLASVAVGLVFAFFTLKAKADQIISGTAINLLVMGLIPVLGKALFDVSGQTPTLSLDDRFLSSGPFFIFAILVVGFVVFYFQKTVLGLRALAAGESQRPSQPGGQCGLGALEVHSSWSGHCLFGWNLFVDGWWQRIHQKYERGPRIYCVGGADFWPMAASSYVVWMSSLRPG